MKNRYLKYFKCLTLVVVLVLSASCNDDDEMTKPTLALGDYHEGGVIFYLDDTGKHGLICAIEDQSFDAEWGCPALSINGADGKAIGMGAQNTIDILAQCSQAGIAADLSASYETKGYSDWFLPSIDELSLIEANKDLIDETALANGGKRLEATEYWSSSEFNSNSVWVEHLLNGAPFGVLKDSDLRNVRSIRAF